MHYVYDDSIESLYYFISLSKCYDLKIVIVTSIYYHKNIFGNDQVLKRKVYVLKRHGTGLK